METKRDHLEGWRHELVEALRLDLGEPKRVERGRPPAAQSLDVLAFEVGAETYGLPIGEVAEILLPRDPTPLPRTPPFVLGLASLRGAVLPVLDLARRLGLPPGKPSRPSRILVVRDGEDHLGFRVDRVGGVIRFADGDIEPNSVAASVDPEFLRGIGYDRAGTLIALLDAKALCAFELERE